MIDLGVIKPGATIRIPWGSYTGSTGASSAASNYADADILIYKDGGTTQRSSASGITATTSFDSGSLTGINLATIDLSDNTDAGFYAAGSEYFVTVGPVTVDSQTVYFPIARFIIGVRPAILNTTIATLSTQTSFTLTAGPAEDDALNGCIVYIHDVASAVQGGFAVVQDYTGSTKTVTLVAGTTYTAAASDNISFMAPALVPTVLGRTLDVASGGEAGLDWSNITGQATAQNLSATNIDVDQVVASVSGAVGSVTGAVGSVTGAVGSVTGNVGGNVVGSVGSVVGAVGSVTGAVGSVAGNVGGNVVGSVGSVVGAVGSVTGNVGGNVAGSVGSVSGNLGGNVVGNVNGNVVGSVGALAAQAQIDVRTAVGLAAADLDTQLASIAAQIAALNDISPAQVLTEVNAALDAVLADSIPADGSRPSLRQAIYMGIQFLVERSVSGTTLTIRKVDGATTLFTCTLNSATTPTSLTRAT